MSYNWSNESCLKATSTKFFWPCRILFCSSPVLHTQLATEIKAQLDIFG